MAIKEIKREWSPCQLDYVKTFLLHSEKDLEYMPKCCVGSKAIVSETDNEYFCTESGWKLGSELGSNEVVILPETVVTVNDWQGIIMTPLSATPTEGATAKVTYNGTEYLCPFVAEVDEEAAGYMLGNLEATGNGGGNPDAPFVVVLIPDGMDDTGDGTIVYGVVMPMEEVTSVTLSIVQTGGAASGGGASGDYIIVADATTLETTQKWSEIAAAVQSKRNVRLEFQSGIARMVLWPLLYGVSGAEGEFLFYTPGTMYNSPARYRVIPGEDDSIAIIKAGND